ncbi:Rap1a immunity protein domain-containing protein [Vibrio crassostreae]|nr:Rap1a immunity protein domain-containing protein [Vibrio crassostreae]CAK1786604.1 Rap1a immunity protein domain-containing protein [Vibrio crassostreae]CAK1837136.1 Rap1a immunity protein domain-containing protein [Vibrio crassostreae]CAK2274337.1 Rap1a immunity protein domain-containing protein [Vibrio crassostreae]CAK2647461.1 Rap1a immunity protein domain-containing protein [Vibrio crassostreae]
MMKWIVLSLTTLCSFSSLANSQIPEIDRSSSGNNPATMDYYVKYYQAPESKEYRDLLLGVRVAADAIDFYTTRLDARHQRIDYCLPMTSTINRETLWQWKTKDLMTIIDNRLKHDPRLKKYGKAGIGGSIASYLTAALKEQYPCPVQKQF